MFAASDLWRTGNALASAVQDLTTFVVLTRFFVAAKHTVIIKLNTANTTYSTTYVVGLSS
jgi:hypothetical protein